MEPDAPGRFSTTTDAFIDSAILGASWRARMSFGPPVEEPTIIRTGRLG